MPISTFDSRARRELSHRKGVQVVLPDGRINFDTPNGKGTSAWFYIVWLPTGLDCRNQVNIPWS